MISSFILSRRILVQQLAQVRPSYTSLLFSLLTFQFYLIVFSFSYMWSNHYCRIPELCVLVRLFFCKNSFVLVLLFHFLSPNKYLSINKQKFCLLFDVYSSPVLIVFSLIIRAKLNVSICPTIFILLLHKHTH